MFSICIMVGEHAVIVDSLLLSYQRAPVHDCGKIEAL